MKLQPKIIELLNKRGICSEDDIEEYISGKPQRTYDPFLLLNMEAGVDLILSAIESDKKICIYGDYDADGITSTVIMIEILSNLTENIMYHIPSRFEEGYGMNCDAVDKIYKSGAEMIITVDCGSVSCEEVAYAKSLGMDVLVTDHHTITDKKSDCLIINPAQKECSYPFRYLAGCGVAFKLAQAIVAETGLPKSILTRVLDLVGIGTIGDIVPLVDENRTLAKYGLRAVNTSERPNLVKFMEKTGLHPGHVTAENVSFVIVPHLNAAGRMEHAGIAVEMLLTKDEDKVKECIEKLMNCNGERKRIQENIFKECVEIIDRNYSSSNFLLIDLEDAHEGVTGIVAGKLKDKYYRPVIIVTKTGDGCLKGTGRSIDGLNIYDMLKNNEELFLKFGGHVAACGFTMKKENLTQLRNSLENQAKLLMQAQPEIYERTLECEIELGPKDINLDMISQMDLLEPCGCANTRPLVGVKGVPENMARMGSDNQYLRFAAAMADGSRLPCVVFRDTLEIENDIAENPGEMLALTGNISSRAWNGKTTIQMTVEDVDSI